MVYAKTQKGREVTPVKPHGLTWPERFLLLLINGQRSDSELRSMVHAREGFDSMIQVLLDMGFVEDRSSAVPAPRPPEVARRTAPQPADIKRAAVRWLTERLGPEADPFCIRIERASTHAELADALAHGRNLAVQQLGLAKAQEFAWIVGRDMAPHAEE